MWLRGQVVKTPPFHGGIMGSSPVGVTNKNTFGCFFVAPTRLLSHSLASLVGLSPCKPCRALTNALRALVPSLRVFMSSFFIHLSYFLRLDRETSFAYVTKKSTSNGGFFDSTCCFTTHSLRSRTRTHGNFVEPWQMHSMRLPLLSSLSREV